MGKTERVLIAIVITLLLHAMVLTWMYFAPYLKTTESPDPYIEMDMVEMEEEELQTYTLEEQLAQKMEEDIANLLADANSERTTTRTSISRSAQEKIQQQVDDDLRNLESEVQGELDANRSEDAQETSQDNSLSEEIDNLKNYDWVKESYNGKVTAEFDLLGREAKKIHIPGYKCKGGGVVVVNIVVNPAGQVIEAEVNIVQTRASEDCLIEEALNSARISKFFVKSSAPKKQSGTITYRFIPQ
jgi:F0F1-type ATP synthase membrane subunit b/b'